jgi:catechol 2,3-dioxygenase-like lactoylglutathione lyase family enzyme
MNRIDFITLGVRDLAVSRRFYVDGLGWEPYFEMPGDVIFLQGNHGLTLSLWKLDELLAEGGGGESSGVPPFSLSHNVDSDGEVREVFDRAVAAGATPLREPAPVDWGGFTSYVADPDGFRWEIAHNPGWGVHPDGRVRLASLE